MSSSFDEFREARLKLDPTARGLSKRQWKQAYDAHLNAKDRVGANVDRKSSAGKGRSTGRIDLVSTEDAKAARKKLRSITAYGSLRLGVNLVSLICVLYFVAQIWFIVSNPTQATDLIMPSLGLLLGISLVLVGRGLCIALIDTADIAFQNQN